MVDVKVEHYSVGWLNLSSMLNLTPTCSRYRSIPRLKEKSRYFILENFPRVAAESKAMLELNVNDFLSIINDDMLNVKVNEWNY